MKENKEVLKLKEKSDKRLMNAIIIFMLFSLFFYISTLILGIIAFEEGIILGTIICTSTILFVIEAFVALKYEVEIGYHECKYCNNKFMPTFKQVFLAPHIGFTRYLKCPNCQKKSWARKVISK